MPDAKPSELIMELYNRGELSERQQAIISQAQQTGKLQDLLNAMDSRAMRAQTPAQPAQAVKPAQPEPGEELGILDYLVGTGEMAGMVGSGAASEFIAPIPAIMATVGMGDIEAYPEIYNRIKEILTYTPKSKGATAQAQWLGEKVGPAMQTAQETWKGVSDIAAEKGGPIAGTAAAITPAALIELLGLGGTRAAKKTMFGKMMKDIPAKELIDETGELLPKIKQALERSGLSVDDFETMAKEAYAASPENVEAYAKIVAKAGKKPSQRILEEVKINPEIYKSAKEFGLENYLLESHMSENPIFRTVQQGLKVPGGELDAKEIIAIEKTAKEADKLIGELGGTTDKAELSTSFLHKAKKIDNALYDKAEILYKDIDKMIPSNSSIDPKNTLEFLNQKAIGKVSKEAEAVLSPDEIKNLGKKRLTNDERRLMDALKPENYPSYDALDGLRKEIGARLKGKGDTFKDSDEGLLKHLYGKMSDDQENAIKIIKPDVLNRYKAARKMVAFRKGFEKQLEKVLGKQAGDELTGDIAKKADLALMQLQKGYVKDFDELIKNIPKSMGKDKRKDVVVTSLNTALTQGSRKQKELNIPGFDDFMKGLNKNKVAKARLTKEIGPEGMRRLESMHNIVSGMRRAMEVDYKTGHKLSVPGIIDEIKGVGEKLYGASEAGLKKAGVNRPPGFFDFLIPKNKKSAMADKMMADPRFRVFLQRKMSGQLNTSDKIAMAEKKIEKIKAYNEWKNLLGAADKLDLSAVGITGFLNGETVKTKLEEIEYEQAMAQEK